MIPSVLYFHQVVREARPEHFLLSQATPIDQFREQMRTVKEHWRPLTMDEFVWTNRQRKPWPKRAVLITFDDGFKNNLWAAEVLHELGLNATIFVISGVVGTRFNPWYIRFGELMSKRKCQSWSCSWGAVDYDNPTSRRRWLKRTKEHLLALRPEVRADALGELGEALGVVEDSSIDPDLEFVNADDLRRLVQLGMTIGAHSRTHDNLAACSERELESEIVESADELAEMAGAPVRTFCYPDGRHNAHAVELVRRRFDAGFTSENRYTSPEVWRFPRRPADACPDIRRILSPSFPARRKIINLAKRILRF